MPDTAPQRTFFAYLDAFASLWLGPAPWCADGVADQTDALGRMRDFVASAPTVFSRTHEVGHVTGSALVVDATLEHVLLTLHAKLGLWLQLGGHADGDPDVARVALREAEEESGLEGLRFLPYEAPLAKLLGRPVPPVAAVPFDLDVHRIPGRPGEPAHDHWDVRFLVVADRGQALAISHESKDLQWFPWEEAFRRTNEESMRRQFRKVMALRERVLT